MKILVMWLGSVVASFFMEIGNELRMYKDAADAGYKISNSKLLERFGKERESKPSLSTLLLLTPVINIMFVMKNTLDYNNRRDDLLTQLHVIGVLEEMSDYEKSEYAKRPTGLNALLVPFKTTMKLRNANFIEIKDENGISSKIFFEFDKKSGDINILDVSGPASRLSYDEQKENVLNAYSDAVESAFEFIKSLDDKEIKYTYDSESAEDVFTHDDEESLNIENEEEKNDEQNLMCETKNDSCEISEPKGPVLKKVRKNK